MKYRKQRLLEDTDILKNKSFTIKYAWGLVFIFVIVISIGYGALNEEMNISGEAAFRPEADIRITDIRLNGATNGGIEDYNSNYSKNNIMTGITLPNIDSTIIYSVTVTNISNKVMKLKDIIKENFDNSNIEYIITGISIDDLIPEMSEVTFQITFRYKSSVTIVPKDTTLESIVQFIFVAYDDEPPVITEVSNTKVFFLTQTSNINLKNYATAFDNMDGDITDKIVITSSPEFNKNKPGTYLVTYNVSDTAGNQAEALTIEIVIWNFVKIVNGEYHCILLSSHGQVWTFGYNVYGQRGLGHTSSGASYRAPTQIPQSYFGGLPVIDIAAGHLSSFALNSAGQAYGWGEAAGYQLGINSITNVSRPTAIVQPYGITFTQISCFYRTGAAIGSDGNVYTWGENNAWGPSGNGNTTNKPVPAAITTSGDFVQVSQGYYGGIAVKNNGQVYVWGTDQENQLGGTYPNTLNKPTLIPSLNNIKEVSYGRTSIFALTHDGQVYAWGDNRAIGALGLGNTTNVSTPTLISGLSNVEQVVAGIDHTLFRAGNNVYGAGSGVDGRIFGGNTANRNVPTLSTLTNVAGNVGYIAGRFRNSYTLSIDGTMVYGIGYCDAVGQEWGSTINQSSSSTAVVPWTFTVSP